MSESNDLADSEPPDADEACDSTISASSSEAVDYQWVSQLQVNQYDQYYRRRFFQLVGY